MVLKYYSYYKNLIRLNLNPANFRHWIPESGIRQEINTCPFLLKIYDRLSQSLSITSLTLSLTSFSGEGLSNQVSCIHL